MAEHLIAEQPAPAAAAAARSRPVARLLRGYVTLALPALLTLISVRLVMTPLFLQLEYNRPGFPADPYGFTTADRLNYAPLALNYLFNGADISYLGDLHFPDGERLYTTRELRHMRDVKTVTRYTFAGGLAGAALAAAAAYILWRAPSTRGQLRTAFFQGSLLTLGIIASIIVVALVSWTTFFNNFHGAFFASGTWIFAYSDTLIRLFPEQFWFDAALTVGGLTALGALAILLLSWRGLPGRSG